MTNYRKKYIEKKSEYLYEKYFEKSFLMDKYDYAFGRYELEKMQATYKLFMLDKRIETRFGLNFFQNMDANFKPQLMDTYSDNSYLHEYRLFRYDIDRKEYDVETAERRVNLIKDFHREDFISNLRGLMELIDPMINKSKEASELYKELMNNFEEGSLAVFFEYYSDLEEVLYIAKANKKEDYQAEIEKMDRELKDLKNQFPYNQRDLLKDEKAIKQRVDEIKEDIKKSQDSLKRLTNIYLYTSEDNGLVN